MLSDIQKLENYLISKQEATLSPQDIEFIKTKISRIGIIFSEMEKRLTDTQAKEKAGVERQKQFGVSQTRVETERHKNIMEELQFMKDAGIVVFNRSSYPFLQRYQKKPFNKDSRKFDKKKSVRPKRSLPVDSA